jgi:ketosteroid isomerase-like protein
MSKLLTIAVLSFTALWTVSCAEAGANSSSKPANTAASTGTAPASAAANPAQIEADLRKMTTDMAASLNKNDVSVMENLYADNYTFIGQDGRVSTKAERVDSMKKGETKYDSISYDIKSVRSNPEGTGAIVISTVTVKGTNMGKPIDGKFTVTHVWSKMKDGWRMVNGQVTSIADSAESKTTGSNSATK